MILPVTPNSSASEFEKLMPMLFGEHGAASVVGPEVHQYPTLRSIFDARLRLGPWSNGTVGHAITYIGSVLNFPDLNRSSGVFDSNGLLERNKLQAYRARIDALRLTAAQDGYHLNTASESDFWRFVVSGPRWRKSNLVLMDNGNLRAVWKNGQGTRLGLQFLGEGMLQHVIFSQREAGKPISRVAGRDTFEGIWQLVEAFDLSALLYE
ncbi:MAG: hypothetical protein OXE51_06930 [Gammaproteobacteria bacterium]|nr:hypothetical protein [Gammaproteobacteria bacterium]